MLLGLTQADADALLGENIDFPDSQYQRLQPITDFRKDDTGISPAEARILYICRRVHTALSSQSNGHSHDDRKFVLKIKVQYPSLLPGGVNAPLPGPSSTTAAELQALDTFGKQSVSSVPHLVTSKCIPQGPAGLFSGGYVAFTVMDLMPGQNLMDLRFWSMTDDFQDEIRTAFVKTLKSIWAAGFAPYDCALRNILWDADTKQCSIVDFEHWHPAKDPVNMNETEEMQRWGIVRRPPPATWAAEWGLR